MNDPRLRELADRAGVATSWQNWAGQRVEVEDSSVRALLRVLGIDPSDPVRPPGPPPCVSATAGDSRRVQLGARAGSAQLLLEDGQTRDLPVHDGDVVLAAGLPPGYHRLRHGGPGGEHEVPVVLAPRRLPDLPARVWGWAVQLYALRSRRSWGMGDYADLAEIARRAGGEGADLVVVNPLGASAPTFPQQPSPYSPSSRRFHSPLYLRPQLLEAYRAADPDLRRRVDELAAGVATDPGRGQLIDRDAVWAAKDAALSALAPTGGAGPLPDGLREFAVFCATSERHGADWRRWPRGAPESADPARVAYHAWLQSACADQLQAAQQAARQAGMQVGIVHDLPVGVDPGGADAWILRGVLAEGASVGAPPDSFNQQGQDWALPPWHPQRLAAAGYAPFREVVQAALRHGGGLRVDHVMGLFRTWWVPPGLDPAQGSYVSYDPEGMLGVLALEASRAGATVIGEDLGTVQPAVERALAERGVLGSTVLLFQTKRPELWRAGAAASISTHDLPTAAGWLAGEHVRIRAELGLLGLSPAQERRRWRDQRRRLVGQLADLGYPEPEDWVAGMHAMLARSPSRVVAASFNDAVGDVRQANLPGTTTAYPNWTLPVADGDGRELGLEAVLEHPGVARISALLRELVR